MRALASLTIVLALVTGIVPQFTNCSAVGRALTLENGNQIPMKCHWSARSEIAIAIPTALAGALVLVSATKEARRGLFAVSGLLGIATILLPTELIGVCSNPDMICHSTMRPLLIFTGALTLVAGAVGIVLASTQKEKTV